MSNSKRSQIKGCGVTGPASLVAQRFWNAMLVGATPSFGANRGSMRDLLRHESQAVPSCP
jgi:hypothetical protein